MNKFHYFPSYFSSSFSNIELIGSDVRSFLQKQCTFNIDLIAPDSFQFAAFLSPKGVVETFGIIVFTDDKFFYLSSVKDKVSSLERLNRFLISEDVELIDRGEQEIFFVLNSDDAVGIRGDYLFESVILSWKKPQGVLETPSLESMRDIHFLSGYPDFDFPEKEKIILNYSLLASIALSLNKGCYPGQETVLKINSGRGAAFSRVLLNLKSQCEVGDIFVNDAKIGHIDEIRTIDGIVWARATILRDYRIDQLAFSFYQNGLINDAVVRYFPQLPFTLESRAQDLFHFGSEKFINNHLDLTESYFRQAIKLKPLPDILESLGVLLGRLNRFDEAIEMMNQLEEVNPHSVLAHSNKSLFYMKLGKITEAEDEKSKATLKSFQAFGIEAKDKERLKQEELEKQQELNKREKMFLEVLEIDPEDNLALFGLGEIKFESKDFYKAEEFLRKVIQVDHHYSQAYLVLGKTLMKTNRKDEARNIFLSGREIAAKKGELMVANQINILLSSL